MAASTSLFEAINELSTKLTDEEHKLLLEQCSSPDSMRSMATHVLRRIGASTVFRQYVAHLDRGKTGISIKNTLPWHAEGERQYAALLAASTATESGARAVYGLDTETLPGHPPAAFIVSAAAPLMLGAQLYLWRSTIEDLADEAPMPLHVISQDLLPHPFMFWSRDVARGDMQTGETNWTFIAHTGQGFRIFSDLAFGQEDHRVSVSEVAYGLTWPRDIPVAHRGGLGSILKRLSFLNSKYVSPETERLPRQWRKEAAREPRKYPNADPTIRVVKLRRETQQKVDQYREQQMSGRRYSGHWWVSGHHRAQWYASREAHEVIWIEPYLKGSQDDPEIKRVYAVVR